MSWGVKNTNWDVSSEFLTAGVGCRVRCAGTAPGSSANRVLRRPSVDSMAEAVVIWTVLGDTLLAAPRRLAQEDAAADRLADAGQPHATTRPSRRRRT